MELISVLTARVIWFVDFRDLNPRGRALRHTLFPALADRYHFEKYPFDTKDNQPTPENPGFRFTDGEFLNSDGVQVNVNLTIHEDGLVADTRSSTRDSEAFLADVTQWFVKDFELIFHPNMVLRKGYVSELNVSPSRPLNGLHPGLGQLAARLSALVSTPEYPFRYEPAGITLSGDPTLELKPAEFRFERRYDAPFSTNRYYTKAAVHTDVHLELLDELEQIL